MEFRIKRTGLLLSALLGIFLIPQQNLMAEEKAPKSEVTLKSIKLVRLGAPIALVEKEYGKPTEVKKSEEYEGVVTYTFRLEKEIKVVVSVWKDAVHGVTYWHEAAASDPDGELRFVAMAYSGGKEWNELQAGYLYQSPDEKLRLWCSAIPAIGVGTVEFLSNRVKIEKKQPAAGNQPDSTSPATVSGKSEPGNNEKPDSKPEGRPH